MGPGRPDSDALVTRTPKRRALSKYPYLPSSASSSRSYISSGASSRSATPLTNAHLSKKMVVNEPFRKDNIFKFWSKQLQEATNLMTFTLDEDEIDDVKLEIHAYPCYPDRTLVKPDDLEAFMGQYYWDLPTCMCVLRDKVEKDVSMFKPKTQPDHWCLACPDAACKYFVNLTEMFENHSETFDCRLCTPRLRFEPKERKPGEKRKVRSLRPKLEPLAESISAIKSPKKALTTSSKLFVAAPTLKAEDVFKTMGNQQRKVTHSEFEGLSPANFKNEISGSWAGMEIAPIDAVNTILGLINPKNPGVTYAQLLKAIFRCRFCDRVMAPHYGRDHTCVEVDDSDSGGEIVVTGHVLGPCSERDSDVEVLN